MMDSRGTDLPDHVTSFSHCLFIVVNPYLTRVFPSEYLKVYLLSIGALN